MPAMNNKSLIDTIKSTAENIIGGQQPIRSGKGVKLRDKSYYDNKYDTPSPEFRQLVMKYLDPLTLNFRLLLNINQSSGLLAGANQIYGKNKISTNPVDYPIDSALSYFLRIGDMNRFNMLVYWILDLIDLVKNYDFLIETVEGLEEINNHPPENAWTDTEVIVTFRETVDSRVQRVLSAYTDIWYDSTRGVVVLPDNLKRIDISVLIYNSGYYNESLYGLLDGVDDIERKKFPTLNKLSELDPLHVMDETGMKTYPFIYHLFRFPAARITSKIGAGYFDNLTNEPGNSEMVKTKLVWEFFGVKYSNSYHSKWFDIDVAKMLQTSMVMMDWQKLANYGGQYAIQLNDYSGDQKPSWMNQFLNSWKDTAGNLLTNAVNAAVQPWKSYYDSKVTEISDRIIQLTDPAYLSGLAYKEGMKLVDLISDKSNSLARRVLGSDTFIESNFPGVVLDNMRMMEGDILNRVKLFTPPENINSNPLNTKKVLINSKTKSEKVEQLSTIHHRKGF